MKTRFIAVLLCAVLALTLCACGGKDKDSSAKSGGKDTGKDSGKSSGSTDTGKQTGGNSSETSKPSGGKQDETTETEEKDNEGELIVPGEEIHLPVVPLN